MPDGLIVGIEAVELRRRLVRRTKGDGRTCRDLQGFHGVQAGISRRAEQHRFAEKVFEGCHEFPGIQTGSGVGSFTPVMVIRSGSSSTCKSRKRSPLTPSRRTMP